MALQGGVGTGGAQQHQIAAHAIHAGLQGQGGGVGQHRVGPVEPGQRCSGCLQARHQGLLGCGLLLHHGLGVHIKSQPGAHDGLAQLGRVGVAQVHQQAEAVQQLRAQLALFGVHGAHQHEARGVLVRQAIAFHRVDATGGHVQQRVHQRVGQQVHLVHVQHTAMSAGHHARRQTNLAVSQHVFEVEGAHQLFHAGGQRQADEWCAGQQVGQGPRRRGLGGAARPADEHTANAGVHRRQQQGLAQLGVAHQGREREPGGRRGFGDEDIVFHAFGPSPCDSRRCSSASSASSMRSRWSPGWAHSPRCMASSRRSPMLRRASGLCCSRKARLAGSCT